MTTMISACLNKKVAIVTPEQRTKKIDSFSTDKSKCIAIDQRATDLVPTFSCKQLLTSLVKRRIKEGMLEDYQTFSIDCKKVIEILCKTQNFCNNNNKIETDADFIDEKEYAYKCLDCGANWPFSNDNVSKIVSHFSSKWSNNFFDETQTPKKHLGKLFEQHQAVLKWSQSVDGAAQKLSSFITLVTIIRCRKCKIYFPGSFDKMEEKSGIMDLLIQHSNSCHKKPINEWSHHRSLSIKSLRYVLVYIINQGYEML